MQQKAQREEWCCRFVQRFEREGEDFLSWILTADETCISLYKLEPKEQYTMCKTPGSPSPKKFKVSRLTKKLLFIMFFNLHGFILSHAVLQGMTFTANYNSKVSLKLNNI